MNRAVLFLLWTQKKNSVREFVLGLRHPKRFIGALFWAAIVAGLVLSQMLVRGEGRFERSGASPLTVLLSFLLVAALFGGLMQRGMTFRAADLDFLFPGPFERRTLVLYRLLSLYPISLLSTLFLMIFLGPRLESPWWGLAGLAICQLIALHLQTISSILAASISEKTFGRLRTRVQFVLLIMVGGGLFATIMAFGGGGGMGADVRALFATRTFAILFYPATAAGALGQAAGFADAIGPLFGLGAAFLVTLWIVLGLQVNFFEASLESSQQFARVMSRVRSGVPIRSRHSGERVRSLRLPALPVFRGGGAIFWKNLLNALRSLRVVFFGLIMTAVLTSVLVGVIGELGSHKQLWIFGAFLPFMLQQHVAFDFRRDIDCLAELKLLPVSGFSVAAAEVAVPALIAFCYQTFLVLGAGCFVKLPALVYAAPIVFYPPVTLAICTVTNIGFLLYPVKAVTASGRPNASGATLSALINMLVLVACLVPATAVALLLHAVLEQPLWTTIGAAIATQYLVDLAMLSVLGRLFAGFDVAREG